MDTETSAAIHNCALWRHNLCHQHVPTTPTKLSHHRRPSCPTRIKRIIHSQSRRHVRRCSGRIVNCISQPSSGAIHFLFRFPLRRFCRCFPVSLQNQGDSQGVNQNRLIAAMALSTLLIAVSSYSAFAIFPQYIKSEGFSILSLFVQRSQMLDALVLFMGPVTGAVAGYAASYLWNKYLRHINA